MTCADDDERGPDHEQDDFEKPAAFAEETAKALELGAEGLDGRGLEVSTKPGAIQY